VLRMLAELDESFDAAADLLLAESVHQLVGGSPLRAGLAADAVDRGQEPPTQFDVLHTRRSGVAVAHHIGVPPPAGCAGQVAGRAPARRPRTGAGRVAAAAARAGLGLDLRLRHRHERVRRRHRLVCARRGHRHHRPVACRAARTGGRGVVQRRRRGRVRWAGRTAPRRRGRSAYAGAPRPGRPGRPGTRRRLRRRPTRQPPRAVVRGEGGPARPRPPWASSASPLRSAPPGRRLSCVCSRTSPSSTPPPEPGPDVEGWVTEALATAQLVLHPQCGWRPRSCGRCPRRRPAPSRTPSGRGCGTSVRCGPRSTTCSSRPRSSPGRRSGVDGRAGAVDGGGPWLATAPAPEGPAPRLRARAPARWSGRRPDRRSRGRQRTVSASTDAGSLPSRGLAQRPASGSARQMTPISCSLAYA
jgi:hypothetical protein